MTNILHIVMENKKFILNFKEIKYTPSITTLLSSLNNDKQAASFKVSFTDWV